MLLPRFDEVKWPLVMRKPHVPSSPIVSLYALGRKIMSQHFRKNPLVLIRHGLPVVQEPDAFDGLAPVSGHFVRVVDDPLHLIPQIGYIFVREGNTGVGYRLFVVRNIAHQHAVPRAHRLENRGMGPTHFHRVDIGIRIRLERLVGVAIESTRENDARIGRRF